MTAELGDVVCEGARVQVCWPTAVELESIIALLNRPSVRKWAVDDRRVDPLELWAMHRFRLGYPHQALLALRWKEGERWIGALGWQGFDPASGEAWLGHLALDFGSLRSIARANPGTLDAPALDASMALCGHLFREKEARSLFTFFLAGNSTSEIIHRQVGFVERAREVHARSDGSRVEVVFNVLTRERWASVERRSPSDL